MVFLLLGESESIGKFQYLFEPITTKGLNLQKEASPATNVVTSETLFLQAAKEDH